MIDSAPGTFYHERIECPGEVSMLKIFLVEDEFVVREGIKKNIDWGAHGYQFCGEASDGELAFPMIQKEKPNILITDIRMPFMDGLALSRLVREQLPDTRIIILSGFEEFEYAKEGIKIGVEEYLTKPISSEVLLREVDKVAEKIRQENREREVHEKFRAEMEENLQQSRRNLFQELINGTDSVPELLRKGHKLNLELSASFYNIILLRLKSLHHTEEEYSGSMVELIGKLHLMLSDQSDLISFDRNLDGMALLMKAESMEQLIQIQSSCIQKMEELFRGYESISYFGGVGKPVNRIRELNLSFEEACRAFACRFLSDRSYFLYSEKLERGVMTKEDDFHMDMVDMKQLDRKKLENVLRIGEKEEVGYFIEEFFKNIGPAGIGSTIFRQYIVMDIYFTIVRFLEEQNLSYENLGDPFSDQDKINRILSSLDHTQKFLSEAIAEAIRLREEAAKNRYKDLVSEACRYISENYADDALSLNSLAAYVNLSPNHLSMVFSQQTGQTFIKYLTDYRISKAKEQLKCTNKKSSEIGMEVGYKDPHYFSYLFKKTQGMTPTQYREGKGAEEE